MDYQFSLVGLLIGLLIGLTGMGGGSLLAPILILLFRIPPVWAVGTDFAYATMTKALGSIVHIRQQHVDFKIALWLACGSVPATFLSASLVRYFRQRDGNTVNNIIIHTMGLVLLLTAVFLIVKPYILRYLKQRNQAKELKNAVSSTIRNPGERGKLYLPLITALIGAVVGCLVGFSSVGSGTLIIVSLAVLFPKLSSQKLVGTDIFQAFLLLAAGSIGYLNAGTINWKIVGLLLIGSLPGVFIGSSLSKFIPGRYMCFILAIVLAISGCNLI